MMRDLIVLVADKGIEEAIKGILGRRESLQTTAIDFQLLSHPNHDPGCYKTGAELLAPAARGYQHGLIVFDRSWQGAPSEDPAVLAAEVEDRLRPAWSDRARCIVIDPELESWVWSDSPHVEAVLGWQGRSPKLRDWLKARGLWLDGSAKPADPKAAYELVLREADQPRSSSIFGALARKVGFERCSDPSFRLLVDTLRTWFGATTP